jgi:hypothetical protein
MWDSDMKLFVAKVFLFTILMVIIDATIGTALTAINRQVNKGDYGRNNYIANKTSQQVLIFGSSRAIHHYDTHIISDSLGMTCYNCGDDGMGIILQYPRLASIVQRYEPRLVIYDIIPAFDITTSDNSKYLARLRLMSNNKFAQKVCYEVDSTEQFKQLSKLYCFNSTFADVVAQYISNSTSTAEQYTYAPLTGELKEEKQSKNIIKKENDSLKLKYLEQFVELCKKHNTKVVFVASPAYKESDISDFKPIEDICKKEHIPLLMHFNDSAYVYDKSLFYDEAHLNQRGAEKYTSQIVQEIKVLLNN